MSATAATSEYASLLNSTLPAVIRSEAENERYIALLEELDRKGNRMSKAERRMAELLTLLIEDFEECNGNNCQPVPFASFSPAVKFTKCSATAKGKSVALSSAELSEVIVNNKDLTKCSVSGTTLTCSYV